jgi:hypothetical protein
MATFEVTSPDGRKFRVTAPDGATQEEAIEYAKQQFGGQSMSGLGKAAAGGLGRGVAGTLGLPGDIGSLASWATSQAGSMLGVEPETVDKFKTQFSQNARFNPLLRPFTQQGSADVQKNIMEPVTGEFYEPQTQTERYVSSVAEMAPGMLVPGGGSVLGRVATNVVAPGLAREGAGQLADTFGKPDLRPYAEVAGAVAGGIAPGLIARAFTPNPTNAARLADVETLRQHGVTDVSAGRITGNKPLQYLEQNRGRGVPMAERAAEQFTQATLRPAGINAPRLTQEVFDDALTAAGARFDGLAARNVAPVDRPLLTNLQNSQATYNRRVNAPNRAPVVHEFVDEIQNANLTHNGQIPGDVYQSLRSRMESEARALLKSADTAAHEAGRAIREMRGALDGAMERGIARNNPNDLGAWRALRNEYRNLLVVEKVVPYADDGLINPLKLRQAVLGTHGKRNYARGEGDYAELSKAAANILKPLPDSGTASHAAAKNFGMNWPSAIGGALGATAGGAAVPGGIGIAPGALVGAAIGNAIPRIAGRAATSGLGQSYLSNQFLTPDLDNRTAALANLLQSLRLLPPSEARQ